MTAMNSIKAREFILSKGVPMSKSRMYKLTSNRGITCHYVGNRLLFFLEELEEWCDNQIFTPSSNLLESQMGIIQSAQNKLNK